MSASFVQSFHVAITLRERWRSEGHNLLPGMRRTSSALTRLTKKEILRAVMTTSSDSSSSSSSFSSSSSSSSETPLSINQTEENIRKKVHARVSRAKAKAMELAKTKRTRTDQEEKEDEEERNAGKTASSKRVLAAETLQ